MIRHRTIGVVLCVAAFGSSAHAAAHLPLVHWNLLRQTLYDPPQSVEFPDSLRMLDGQTVRFEGYLLPHFGSQDPGDLLLSALHPWGVFCGPTDMTALVEVHLDGFDPKGPWPDLPVEVSGTFWLSRRPEDLSSIYRLRGTSWRRLHTWEQDFPGVVDEIPGDPEP